MDILTTINLKYKPILDTALVQSFSSLEKLISPKLSEQQALLTLLTKHSVAGKGIRGSLILHLCSQYGVEPKDSMPAAVAMELFHTGLLVHDDVYDNDTLRRGLPTLHTVYAKNPDIAHNKKEHFGISMATNAGDFLYFLAMQQLSHIQDTRTVAKIAQIFSKELMEVILAQMADVRGGSSAILRTKDEITVINLYKTARYSFSLPFMTAATLIDLPDTETDMLSKIGEHIGIIYQLRDDELSIIGNEQITGKPVGNDQKEGKQTLLSLFLTEEFGDLTKITTENLSAKYLQSASQKKIQAAIVQHTQAIDSILTRTSLPSQLRDTLVSLTTFAGSRNR